MCVHVLERKLVCVVMRARMGACKVCVRVYVCAYVCVRACVCVRA